MPSFENRKPRTENQQPGTEILVSDETAGVRLDQFLRRELPHQSRSFLQKLIKQGCVRVTGRAARPSYKVRAGDAVHIEIPPAHSLAVLAERIPLDILFEDSDLIVVNKPAGLVVHPAAGNQQHTLVNALLHHCRGGLAGIGGVERPGIVHRLDKGTSGCMVVAKTDFAHQTLVAQFKSRDVEKIYRAVCRGRFERPSGRVETLIGRSERDRKKMSARVTRGRLAVTDYRVVKQFPDFALVELHLHTGRTHQIRVHMAHIGHPVLGDKTYGKPEKFVARPMLHAYKLGFTHPRSKLFVEFIAPVPEDMVKLCPP